MNYKMKAIAFKLVLRSWWRNKTFSIISIVSLAIGIACTNLLAIFVIHEYNLEADNPHRETGFVSLPVVLQPRLKKNTRRL